MTYFQLDETHEVRMHLVATSLGLNKPDTVAIKNNAVIDQSQRISIVR